MAIKKNISKMLSELRQDPLVLPEKTRFSEELIVAAELVNSDLSQPIFDGCAFENCRFENTDFSNSRFFNATSLNNCEFVNVDFRVSGLNDSRFENCNFSKCDFRQTSLADCHFKDCTFNQCKIVKTSFTVANLVKLTFAGKLQEVQFLSDRQNTPLLSDFRNCKLDYVSFQNCDLENIVPPQDAQHLYFRDVSSRAKVGLESLSARPEGAYDKILKRRLQNLSAQHGAIFNIKNLESHEGVEVATALISLLNGAVL